MLKKIILLIIVAALVAAAHAAALPDISQVGGVPQVTLPMAQSSQGSLVYASSPVETNSVTHPRATGNISVNSTPAGARVWLDYSSTGKDTPVTLTEITTSRLHTISLKMSGYKVYSKSVRVTAGNTATIDATLVAEVPKGNISVNSTPTGALIYLNDRSTGKKTPYTIEQVKPGTHSIKLKLSGYNTYSTIISVASGATTTVEAGLTPLSGKGAISFKSSPTAAKIFLDGVDTGKTTPALLVDIAPGKHSVSLMITSNITVIPGKKTTVVGMLSRK